MSARTIPPSPGEGDTVDQIDQVIGRLTDLAIEVDLLWKSVGSRDFDLWNGLADASRSVHRALNCLTLDN